MQISYSEERVPDEYKCGVCGAHGVKLWREYQTCAPSLFCLSCAQKAQKRTLSWAESDSIGWLVPAVPDEEGVGYWGYTSVPAAGCRWWHMLEPKAEGPRYAHITASNDEWVAHLRQSYLDSRRYDSPTIERAAWRAYADEATRLGIGVNPHEAKAVEWRIARLAAEWAALRPGR